MSPWDFEIATRTLWQEARGEPFEGQCAVAHVLLNRLKSGKWGDTLATVCLSPLQFSGWNARDPNRLASAKLPDDDETLLALGQILIAAMNAPDPTAGATHYYAETMPKAPPWVAGATACGKFGRQLFFKDVK